MPSSVKQMLEVANEEVPRISAEEARRLIDEDGGLLVDVRDPHELAQSGKLQGALNVSRGMLEFRADSDLPYYDPQFRKDRAVILYCASGGRSALSGKTLRDMGYGEVYNLGGFKDAAQAGFPCEEAR